MSEECFEEYMLGILYSFIKNLLPMYVKFGTDMGAGLNFDILARSSNRFLTVQSDDSCHEIKCKLKLKLDFV